MTESSDRARLDPKYFLRNHDVDGSEAHRLDELHSGFHEYLKGNLSFAPLESPKTILDLGAGSGAWAIEAATTFPKAEVIAADIRPLPQRDFPSNMKCLSLDLLDPLPFQEPTFDLVHMRIVLYHVGAPSHGLGPVSLTFDKLPAARTEEIIERISHIIKPNGWLVIEDFGRHTGHSTSCGPAQAIFDAKFMKMLRGKGLNPTIGEQLGSILQNTDLFSEINIKKVELVLTTDEVRSKGTSGEPGEGELSKALRSTIEKVVELGEYSEDFRSAGITSELTKAWLEERKDPAFMTFHDVWFSWSRKRSIV